MDTQVSIGPHCRTSLPESSWCGHWENFRVLSLRFLPLLLLLLLEVIEGSCLPADRRGRVTVSVSLGPALASEDINHNSGCTLWSTFLRDYPDFLGWLSKDEPKTQSSQGQAGHPCWPIRPATRPQCCWKEVRAAHLKLLTHGTDFLQVEYVCLDAGQVPGDVPATLSVPSFRVALRDLPSPNLRRCPSL